MRKLLLALPLFVMLMTGVFAVSIVVTDMHKQGGVLNYLGSDNSFSFVKTDFDAWHRTGYSLVNGNQGQGTLQVTAITSLGERVTLNLNLREKAVLVENANQLYVDNTATGTYWKKGSLPVSVNFGTVRYDLNKVTGLVNIAGETTGFSFRVTGMTQ